MDKKRKEVLDKKRVFIDERRVLKLNPHVSSLAALEKAIKNGERIRVIAKPGSDVSQKQVDIPIGKTVRRVKLDGQNFITEVL